MGPKRSLQTLLKMNHVDGFDCPSCARPDPDRRKAAGEWSVKTMEGWGGVTPADSDDTLRFAELRGVVTP